MKKSHTLHTTCRLFISKIEKYWTFMVIDPLGHQVDTDLSSRKLEKIPL